ncbi:hypothetical protein ABG067_008016, partial [Albugo candida]
MMILDTKTKSWTEKRSLVGFKKDFVSEGTTVQISRQKDGTPNFAYFFGGYILQPPQSIVNLGNSRILNLQNNTWLNIRVEHNERDKNYVIPRGYASSSLISKDNLNLLVVLSGKSPDSMTLAVADVDIARLPKFQSENAFEEAENDQAMLQWVPSISSSGSFDYLKKETD